ncbi:MAG: Stf0 sulfotransferase family protein [Gammaproteobacteria bacterium]|nr:Stf0 sulfotransferase family protein [Gammaproteobacteria bacterium]
MAEAYRRARYRGWLDLVESHLPMDNYLRISTSSKALDRIPVEDLVNEKFDQDFAAPTTDILIIFSTPRSGSTLLCELLLKNSVCIAHEYLQSRQYLPLLGIRWGCVSGSGLTGKTLDLKRYADCLLRYRTLENGWFGLNLHGEHLKNYLKIEGLLPDVKFHYLQILRKDIVSQAVSYEIASQTDQWSRHFSPTREVNYSFFRILHKLYRIQKQNALIASFLAARKLVAHQIYYEDLVTKPGQVLSQIPNLSLEKSIDVESSLTRQTGALNAEWTSKFSKRFLNFA